MTRQHHDFDRATAKPLARDLVPPTVARSLEVRSQHDERREHLIRALARESDLRHDLLRRRWRGA